LPNLFYSVVGWCVFCVLFVEGFLGLDTLLVEDDLQHFLIQKLQFVGMMIIFILDFGLKNHFQKQILLKEILLYLEKMMSKYLLMVVIVIMNLKLMQEIQFMKYFSFGKILIKEEENLIFLNLI